MQTLQVKTDQRDQMVEITGQVQAVVTTTRIKSGRVTVFVPHTTAGITINENADPDVVHDFLKQLDEMVPWSQPFYRHGEGNSASHVKASMMGSSVDVLMAGAKLVWVTWLGFCFCLFAAPRPRLFLVNATGDGR
jgi:secondary thiamine-phosphate synthase enzyme